MPTLPLNDKAYEPIRRALFESPPGQGAAAAKQAVADELVANPLDLMLWLVDAGVVNHVVFNTPGVTVSVSSKDAPPFCSVKEHPDL